MWTIVPVKSFYEGKSCLAAEAGIPVHVVESPTLVFDIDLPEDYRLVLDCRD